MEFVFKIFYYLIFGISIFFVVFKFIKGEERAVSTPIKVSIKTIMVIVAIVFGSRIVLYLLSWAFTHASGYPREILDVWKQWDANAYIYIAENGYFNEAEGWIRIVFYPLYSCAVWLFKFVFINDIMSALMVSWLCLSGACIYLYKLMLIDYDRKTANRAVKYLLIFPTTIFLGAPYTESMFLLFCFGCIYYTRLQKFSRACIFGFLAALTRNVGVLLVLLIFVEMLYKHNLIPKLLKQDFKNKIKGALKDFSYLLIIPLGTVVYLALNQLILGDPLAFMVFQQEHWCQTFGSYGNTLWTTFNNMISEDLMRKKILLWINQFIVLILGGVSLPVICKKMKASYGVYSIAYIFIVFAPTWLLSGLRYYMGLAPLYPALAIATRRKCVDITLTVVFILLAITLAGFYSIQNEVL